MPPLSPRQRLLTALRGGQPDRVPIFDWPFSPPLYAAYLGFRPASYNGRDAARLALALGLDGVPAPDSSPDGYVPAWLDDRRYRDEWGVLRQVDPAAWPLNAPIGPAEGALADYAGPDPWAAGRERDVQDAAAIAGGEIAVIGAIDGPFSRPWMIAGMERFMLLCYDAPPVVEHLVRLCTDFAIVTGQRLAAAGADALIIADDFGYNSGPFLSLAHFRRYILPELRRELAALRPLGLPILLHSCGNVSLYLDDLATTDIAGLNPLQRTAGMDLAAIKARYGRRWSLIGNIDASRTLPFGTPAEVEQEVIATLQVGAPGGGYVLCSDHSLHSGIPVENVRAMLEAGRRYGAYAG